MKTRSVVRIERMKEQDEEVVAVKKEETRAAAEEWVKVGKVINPGFQEPSADTLAKWKLFINSAQTHPNILAHPEVECFRTLLQLMGGFVTVETCHLIVELGNANDFSECKSEEAEEQTVMHVLQPCGLQLSQDTPVTSVFGKIDDFDFLPGVNAVIVRDYCLMSDLKSALEDLVDFVWTYPEVMLYPQFEFLHDFMVSLGVSPDLITYEIYQTQLRRSKGLFPASTLLLKLGVPEFQRGEGSYQYQNEINEREISSDFNSHCYMDGENGRRVSGSAASDDSGLGDSDWSGAGSFTQGSQQQAVVARKSEVKWDHQDPDVGDGADDAEEDEEEGGDDDNEKRFQCPVCLRRYVSKGNCNWHIRKRHPGNQLLPGSKAGTELPTPTHFCKICGKGFTAPQYLRNHIERLHPSTKRQFTSISKNPPLRRSSYRTY